MCGSCPALVIGRTRPPAILRPSAAAYGGRSIQNRIFFILFEVKCILSTNRRAKSEKGGPKLEERGETARPSPFDVAQVVDLERVAQWSGWCQKGRWQPGAGAAQQGARVSALV
ncbi:hypothetical protein GOBAR_DD32700 [Gossypium barbadense]|nr:hypothetical protein GOBAR_DD32700 [Gossypium barbadense]